MPSPPPQPQRSTTGSDMLTAAAIQGIAPRARPEYVQALIDGQQEMLQAGLNTPLRLACFLGQCLHETGGLSILREDTSWKPETMVRLWPQRFKTQYDPRIQLAKGDKIKLANVAYGGNHDLAQKLGNTVEDDDGWAYRGGGFLQHTGRACYAEVGSAIGIDLEGEPDLIEDGPISLAASLYTWVSKDLNRLADRGYIRAIGNAINRGDPYSTRDPIGHEGRLIQTQRAMHMLGASLPNDDALALGAQGPKVGQLQARLQELGYPCGAQDSVFGPSLARAVAAFKLDHQRRAGEPLELAELVGPLTWRALDMAKPMEVVAGRQNASEADLMAKGSTEMLAGHRMQQAGGALALAGVARGAHEIGALDAATLTLSKVNLFQATLVPAIKALQWGFANIFWVVLIALAVWVWSTGRGVKWARLAAHRLGINLGR